jgi:predicted nucleotidyltransferase
MSKLDEIRRRISLDKGILESEYHVRSIGIFGSVAKGEETGKSDLDVLVDFSKPVGLFDLIRLEERLERITGMTIDLVPLGGIKSALRESILSNVVYV